MPPDGFAEAPLLQARGLVCLARRDQIDAARGRFEAALAAGAAARWLTREEALSLCPILRPDYVAGAFHDPRVFDIDVETLHRGFLNGARRSGCVIETGQKVRALTRAGGCWHIETPKRAASADVVVNAAGAWADHVAALAGLAPLGLNAYRRTAILVDPPHAVEVGRWPFLLDADEQFYIKPDAGKLLVSPCDEDPQPPGDSRPDELTIAIAADRAMQAMDLEIRRVTHSWSGLRTSASDQMPIIGFDPETSGFFWSAGQGGFGIQTSPAWGFAAAGMILEHGSCDRLAEMGVPGEAVSPARLRPVLRSVAQ